MLSSIIRKPRELRGIVYDEKFDKSLGKRIAIAPLFTKKGDNKEKEKAMSLSDLSKIQIPSVSEIKQKKDDALKRKTYAEEAGKLLSGALASIGAYKDIEKQGGVLSSNDKAEMERLCELVDKLRRSGDPEIQKHIEFSEFMEEVRNSTPSEDVLGKLLEKAVALGRRKITERCIKDIMTYPNILFRNKLYVCPFENKTPAQEGLNAELWKLASTVRKEYKNKLEDGACENMSLFKKGESSKYKILFLKRTDESGRKWESGTGYVLISVRSERMGSLVKAITVLGGQGSARWLEQSKGQWFPFCWFEKGIPGHVYSVRPEFAKFAERAIKMLKAGIASYYSRQKVGK